MANKRERQRRRIRAGRQDRVLARERVRRGPKPGRRDRAQWSYAEYPWYAVALGLLGGGMFLAIGVDRWIDHWTLADRGQVVQAEVVGVETGGHGDWVGLRFTTADGAKVDAEVVDPPADADLDPGDRIAVRYDPADPVGRIEFVGDDQQVFGRWMFTGAGGALTAFSGYYGLRRLTASRRRLSA